MVGGLNNINKARYIELAKNIKKDVANIDFEELMISDKQMADAVMNEDINVLADLVAKRVLFLLNLGA